MDKELEAELDELITQLRELEKKLNDQLKGRDVRLLSGRYKNRLAQVQSFYFDGHSKLLHVLIYRLDNRSGFKGRERFIDDHRAEYVFLSDVKFVENPHQEHLG